MSTWQKSKESPAAFISFTLAPFIGNQTGGRVFLFLYTDDFERDYAKYQSRGVKFVRDKVLAPYGTVAVFQDLYGNQWDLIQLQLQSR